MAPPDRPVGAARSFWARHCQLLAAIFIAAAAALDFGPDGWMEFIMWGTTVVTVAEARVILAVLALLVAVALFWPLIRPSRPRL